MPFLEKLMYDFKAEQAGDELFVKQGRKRVKAAWCDHVAGHWKLTPEGEAIIAGSATDEVTEDTSANPMGLSAELTTPPEGE